jgi:uncharacterized membrane protein YfcA
VVGAGLVVFAAGVVCGISGFGFSAVCVAGLSMFVAPSQVVPAIFILEVVASISMLRGAVRIGTGVVAGFVNGVAAIGGIVIALLLSTAQVPPATLRATMVVLLLLIMEVYARAWAAVLTFGAAQGPALLNLDTLWLAAWMAPAMLTGIWVGSHFFARMSVEQFRRHILNLLVLLAVAGVIRALTSLIAA